MAGGRLYSGGAVGNFFGDVLGGGVENKMTYGQGGGGVMYFGQYWGRGVRCVPLVFLFIKRPPPPISQLYNVRLS